MIRRLFSTLADRCRRMDFHGNHRRHRFHHPRNGRRALQDFCCQPDRPASQVRDFCGCACRKSNPDILVVQPAENWAAKNVPGPLDVMGHGRRQILWFGVTSHPTAEWMANQLTEACGWEQAPRYLIRDRDRVFGELFVRRLRSMGIRDRPTSPRSPWQNGFAERLRSEEHTSELQSQSNLVCRLLLEKKKKDDRQTHIDYYIIPLHTQCHLECRPDTHILWL